MKSTVTRREAVETGIVLMIGFALPLRGKSDPEKSEFNAWVRISSDNQITVLAETPEMGQGTRTANIMMLAEELELDWSSVRWEQAPTIPRIYKNLEAGGSSGTIHTWLKLRKAGAQAREMLLAAGAQRWGVDVKECHAENCAIVHTASGRRIVYGDLVRDAVRLPVPDPDHVPLKDPKDFRVIGKPLQRVDIPGKVDGSAVFGLDVRRPGMLYALIARPPHFGGKALHVDDSDAKASPGVKAVFAVPAIGYVSAIDRNLNVAGGVAVVADSTWNAMQGRKALNITWDQGRDESTATLQAQFRAVAAGPASVVNVDRGKVEEVLTAAAKRIEANYEFPFQAHATMEPMNTTVHVRDDGQIDVWTPTQIPAIAQQTIAALANIPPETVNVQLMLSGGSFGRRYQWDYLAEAYNVAKNMKAPVQLVWTREDDMQHDFYLQYSFQRMRAVLEEDGRIAAWWYREVTTPIAAVFSAPEKLKDPKNVVGLDWNGETPYDAANFRADYAPVLSVVPRAWWRSVSSPFQVFAIECFMDELAHAAGKDPLHYRLERLRADKNGDADKLRSVLQLVEQKSNWGNPLPKGQGRGVACCVFGKTAVAHVAEVSVVDEKLHVLRVVSAVHCGLAVNPDNVRAQIEGAINYALTPVLHGEISVKDGGVQESNFHDYQVARIKDAPEIEVHLVPPTTEPSSGVGEAGVPPLAPAVANAVFAATGKRMRRLPILKVS
jgi:isoquinoline 1-oxidoreductase beta subunit